MSMRVSENTRQHVILLAASTLQGWPHIHRAVAESVPDVLENRDKSNLVELEDDFPYPCDAEDGDDDVDDVFSKILNCGQHFNKYRMFRNNRNNVNKRISILVKHEVGIEQSCHACHL